MISRRNIRIKVMQCLYANETMQHEIKEQELTKALIKSFDATRSLFIFLIHTLTEVALYAETDARHRAAKHLPTDEDLHINTKIAQNELLLKILKNESYLSVARKDKPEQYEPGEWIKKLYHLLCESQQYKTYIQTKERIPKSEKMIMEFIFNELMIANEDFDAFIEENFLNWQDDADMLQQLMLGFLAKPSACNFHLFISKEKIDFGIQLLKTVVEKEDQCIEFIKPKLQNWDPDRTALLDMLLIKMGICELLYFETIPTKVTLNEYIDIAKDYSTQQSGHFVNGILDSIHKDLLASGKIQKVSFKKVNKV